MQTSYEEGRPLLFMLLVFSVKSLQRDTFFKVSPIYPNITVDICNDTITVKNSMAVPQKSKNRITIRSNAMSPYVSVLVSFYRQCDKTQSELGEKEPQLKNCLDQMSCF